MLNTDIVEGKWKEIKGKIRTKWAEFTDQEVEKMKGTQEELEGALQKKYGYKKEEAREHINAFIKECEKREKDSRSM